MQIQIKSNEIPRSNLSMGINPDEKFVTLGTGANGTNNHLGICREMNKSFRNSNVKQIVALCGDALCDFCYLYLASSGKRLSQNIYAFSLYQK